MPVYVRGLHELQAGLAHADKQVRLGVRKELRHAAEPVQRGAEDLARANITRIGPRWSKMRVGITRDLVYVAPHQRGVKSRAFDSRRRGWNTGPPSFPQLLLEKAMEPSLERHAGEVEARLEEFLDRVADDFNRGA